MGKLGIITRAGLTLGAVGVIAGGVTLAALQDTATLTDNTISSATAGLLVNNGADATFSESESGYTFADLVPGADYVPGNAKTFSLQNEGTADLQVTVFATVGTMSGVLNKNKVHVQFDNLDDSGAAVEYTLAQLEALFNDLPGVTGAEDLFGDDSGTVGVEDGEVNDFTINVKMDADAISGGAATLSDFDLVFTGTAVEPTPAP